MEQPGDREVNRELDGEEVRIPGHVVPLELDPGANARVRARARSGAIKFFGQWPIEPVCTPLQSIWATTSKLPRQPGLPLPHRSQNTPWNS